MGTIKLYLLRHTHIPGTCTHTPTFRELYTQHHLYTTLHHLLTLTLTNTHVCARRQRQSHIHLTQTRTHRCLIFYTTEGRHLSQKVRTGQNVQRTFLSSQICPHLKKTIAINLINFLAFSHVSSVAPQTATLAHLLVL